MMQNEKDEIRSELVGILEPIENVRNCLKKISLSDEWAPAKEYFVRRHEILGIISYGVSKRNKIHKVNFWNSTVNYYVSETTGMEKIPNSQIQEEVLFLENTLVDFLILISSGFYAWNLGNGIIKILRNQRIYSIYLRNEKLIYNEQTFDQTHLELEIRTIMDFILKKGKLKTIELTSEIQDFISVEIPILPKDRIKKQTNENFDLKESMLDFLIDSGLELEKAKGKEKEILEEVNYGLLNTFQSIDSFKQEIQYLTEDTWDVILAGHQTFLESLPEGIILKWERVGSSIETEIQYLSKKFPNYQLQGKLIGYKLKEFLLDSISLRVINISRSYFFDSNFTKVDFSNSISVFSRWKNDTILDCNFKAVDFSDSEMVDCKFKDCNFSNTDFESVTFEECIFTNCDFSNAKFKKAIFYKCKFIDCKFKKTRFIEAILYLSVFENSDIQKAINKNSEFNECSFT